MAGFIDWFGKICRGIDCGVRVALTTAFYSMFLLLMLQVFARFFFGYSIAWMSEYIGYSLGLITTWGASCLILTKKHIGVRFLRRYIPSSFQGVIEVVGTILLIYYITFYIEYGYRFALGGVGVLSPSERFELFYPRFLILPVGASLIMLQTINVVLHSVYGKLVTSKEKAFSIFS